MILFSSGNATLSAGPSVDSTVDQSKKESDGYIVIEKGENCWEACGAKRGWSGFCSFCSLSNGSPGFCCNPRSAGGCSAGMVKAVRNSDLRKILKFLKKKNF